jgi:Domain of unknown function (DUF397)
MEGSGTVSWRKSSYSGNNGGNCVEAGSISGRVLVRDTQDRTGAVLQFSANAWRVFAGQIEQS